MMLNGKNCATSKYRLFTVLLATAENEHNDIGLSIKTNQRN